MRNNLPLITLLFSFFLSHAVFGLQPVNIGHSSAVQALSADDYGKLLFSGDRDGAVRIWDIADNSIIANIQVSHLPLRALSIHPTKSQFAVIESDNINTFRLSVWDWKEKDRLFSVRIEENPLFFQYSSQGNFILYGKTDVHSLTFIDSTEGYRLPLVYAATGIVSAAFVSGTENTMVTYGPTGSIQYWDLQTGARREGTGIIRTRANLSSVNFLPNGVYLTAAEGDLLNLINITSGRVEFQTRIPGLIRTSFDPISGQLAAYSFMDGRFRISTWNILFPGSGRTTASMNQIPGVISAPQFRSSTLIFRGRKIFTTDMEGSIYQNYSSGGMFSLFSKFTLNNITDIGLSDGKLLITTDTQFFLLESDIFSNTFNGDYQSGSFRSSIYPNRYNGKTKVIYGMEQGFYLHSTNSEPGKIFFLSKNGDQVIISDEFSSPLLSARPYGERDFLTLERDGTVSIINGITGRRSFSYSAFGQQIIEELDNGNVISGRNRTAALPFSLMHINPRTGETVPIDDTNLINFQLNFDPVKRILYSIGFEERRGTLRTVLKSHGGNSFDRVETLLAYPGEDHEASLTIDPKSSRVFTSLGYGVHMLSWDGFTSLERSEHLPRKLTVHSDLLFSLNKDSSITIWNIRTGDLVMNFFLFKDMSWVVTGQKGVLAGYP